MSDTRKQAAKEFAEFWEGKGYEKGESQSFWLSLLRDVYGVDHPEKFIEFEEQVHLDNTSFIDGMIQSTKVMIEQKSLGKDLSKAIKQSDGSMLTPFQQAKRYRTELPYSKQPRWVVICNFEQFNVYDMEQPGGDPEVIMLKDLPKDYYRLQFLVDTGNEHTEHEKDVSVEAGEIVGQIYDAFAKQYADPESEHALHSLNVLCVRLVFCLYAENSEILGHYGIFRDYMAMYDTWQMRKALIELFQILDTPIDNRDPYLKEDNPELAAFPYVNGNLFSDEDIEIPPFTDEIRDLLLNKASEGFNWSEISPTIFGAVFESTLNPETRRSGGMHYTSVENIHKVIKPLFLDNLEQEFAEIRAITVERTRNKKLDEFQTKLSTLTFLDPACGSGNFLTESYLSLRRLENDILKERKHGQMSFAFEGANPIQVTLDQFYGIEINDFAVSVAMTALWIAEIQTMQETEDIIDAELNILPLKSYTNIVEGNALRMDWNDVAPRNGLNYIMGNPPFSGYSMQTKEQKSDIRSVYINEKGKPYKTAGKIDYVSGWYFKASQFMVGTSIRAAFVSTNSITQGEQVAGVWKPLYDRFGIHIDFAYRTFLWNSEATDKAKVHCVIVGFSVAQNSAPRKLYKSEQVQIVKNINAYLIDAPTIFVESRGTPLANVPPMSSGGKPVEGGNLIFTTSEKDDFLKKEPDAAPYFKRFVGADDFINGYKRWCLWLVGISPNTIHKLPYVMQHVEAVREYRLSSTKAATRACAETPTLFMEIKEPHGHFMIVPEATSDKRRYIPMDYVEEEMVCSNTVRFISDTTVYHFGILMSNVHMAWTRVVCGRLRVGYRYSNNIVYNNFPWPDPTPEQRARIEQTAQAILDARALYPDSSLADLYDDLTMPPELRKAHQDNDRAVMDAYGFTKGTEAYTSEAACVAELMKMYQKLTSTERS